MEITDTKTMKEKVFRMIDDSAQELQAYAADVASAAQFDKL